MSMYILIPILLLFPYNTKAQNCLKLTNSKACPAFQNYYINLGSSDISTLPQPAWLSGVNDINTFDEAILNHLNSTSYAQTFWTDQLGCTPVNTNSTPYAQYSTSVACAQLILDPAVSLPCNFQYNILPNPLCTESCQDYATSVAAIVNDTRICKKASNFSTNGVNAVQQMCSNNSALTGTPSSGCVNASQNEVQNCGFQNDTETLCNYCQNISKNSSSSCCAAVDCSKVFAIPSSSSLSPGSIAGIVIGCLLFIAILGAVWWWCCRPKYRRAPQQGLFKPYYKSTNTVDLYEQSKPTSYRQKMDTDRLVELSPVIDSPETEGFLVAQSLLDGYCQVIHAYYPRSDDEVQLAKGDIARLIYTFDDGWALADNITTCQRGLLPLLCVASISSEEVANALGMSLDDPHHMADPTATTSSMLIREGANENRSSYLLTDDGLERLQRSLSVRTSNLPVDIVTESPSPSPSPPQRSISMRNPQLIKRYSQVPLPYASELSPMSASDDSIQALRPSIQGARSRYSQGYEVQKPPLIRKSSA